MQSTLLDKIKTLVDQYNKELNPYGVKCIVKRKYLESRVMSYSGSTRNPIDWILESFYKKKEECHFHHVPNRYKCVILSVMPIEKDVVMKNDCKCYTFVIESIEREYEGKEPKYLVRNEEKVLKLIEKRLKKLLKRAEKEPNAFWCKNNFIDKIRYTLYALKPY